VVDVLSRIAAPAAGCAALLAITPPALAQVNISPAESDAYSVSASFTSQNMSTELKPVDEASGTTPPYDVVKKLAHFSQTIAIPPLVPTVTPPVAASFAVTADGLRSEAVATVTETTSIVTTGKSHVTSAELSIRPTVLPITPIVPPPYLLVDATKVDASATLSRQSPLTPKASGTASFGSLTVTGSLLDGKTVTYSGSAPPNTVLFQSATVTITVHQQVIVGLISCGPSCTFTPDRINVQALDIALTSADIDGRPVSGDIVLGAASAE
jgi:hypothetical protein